MIGLRKRGSRSVVLETDVTSKGKVLGDERWANMEVTLKELGKVLPRVIVYDVPRNLGEAEVLGRILLQNLDVENSEEYKGNCRIVFMTGRRSAGGS